MEAIGRDVPFIMKPDGLAWLFAPGGTQDAPFPTHYEPVESPVRNLLYKQQDNPTVRYFEGPMNPLAHTPSEEFPVVGCTFRVTEQYLSGPMSRFNSWLNESMPAMFVSSARNSPQSGHRTWGLAARSPSPRGEIEARAMVTRRIKPMIDRRADHPSDRHPVPVGLRRGDRRQHRQRPGLRWSPIRTSACMRRRSSPARSARAAPTASPACRPSRARWPNREPIPDTPAGAQPEGHLERKLRKDGPTTK